MYKGGFEESLLDGCFFVTCSLVVCLSLSLVFCLHQLTWNAVVLYIYIWVFPKIGVPPAPKSSILIGFSIINHPFWGTPIYIYIFIVYIHCLDDIINTCWGLVQKRQQAADDWNDINNNSHNKKYYKQSLSLKWSWMQWQWQWWSSLIFIAIKLIITICCVFKHLLLSPCLIALQCSPIFSPKAARNKPGSAKP